MFKTLHASLKARSIGMLLLLGSLSIAAPAHAATPLVVSAKVTGPTTVAIVYSEAVNTVLNDYSNFTGALHNASLVSIAGSGTNTITLTFTNITLAADATGYLTISNTVKSISDNSPLGGGQYSVTDGRAPVLSSFSMSSNLAGGTVARTGNAITINFTASEFVTNVTATIDGHTVTLNGSGTGPYSVLYGITASDAQDVVPVTVAFTDLAGNPGSGSFMLGGGLGPRIVSITSDAASAGAIGVGSTINFVLTLASPAPNATVSGSYDGVPLSWTTANGGATYTAAFTVRQSAPATNVPLQISGVTVRDSSGNVSAAGAGSDIQKTINSQSFLISQIMPVPSPIPSGTAARFGFSSPQDGIITYGGACTSPNQTASMGTNYTAFSVLPDGTYNNCTLTVTDAAGYQSNTLAIPAFVVGGGVPAAQTTPAPAPTASQTTTTTTKKPASYAYQFTKSLIIGSNGAEVTALQKRLTDEGLYTGPITGKFGATTSAALKKFQKLHNLTQLGTLGPSTRAALNKGL